MRSVLFRRFGSTLSLDEATLWARARGNGSRGGGVLSTRSHTGNAAYRLQKGALAALKELCNQAM